MAEGEQLLRLGDYLRWVKEAKALLQQCNHGKEDGKEDGKAEGYVKSVFVTHVGCFLFLTCSFATACEKNRLGF